MPTPQKALFDAEMTTRQAYNGAVTGMIVKHLMAGGWLDTPTAQGAEIAVHEGLVNAIIHGNLEIPGLAEFQRQRGGSVDHYYETVATRLESDLGWRVVRVICRPVRTLLVVHIENQGPGYPTRPHRSREWQRPPQASGNGWPLMQAFSRRQRVSKGGRRLSLGFLRTAVSSS